MPNEGTITSPLNLKGTRVNLDPCKLGEWMKQNGLTFCTVNEGIGILVTYHVEGDKAKEGTTYA